MPSTSVRAQRCVRFVRALAIRLRKAQRRRQSHRVGHVLGPGAPVALLRSPQNSGDDAGPSPHEDRPHALWPVDLVGRDRQQIDAELLDVEPQAAGRLHRVRVQQRRATGQRRADLGDGLYRSDLVVGVHHAHQRGVIAHGAHHGVRVDPPLGIDRHVRRAESMLSLQVLDRVQDAVVLDSRRDQVRAALAARGPRGALHREVGALTAATGEDDLTGIRAHEAGHGFARVVKRVPCLPAFAIDAAGIPARRLQMRQHRRQHVGMQRRRRRVVEIDAIGLRRVHGRPVRAAPASRAAAVSSKPLLVSVDRRFAAPESCNGSRPRHLERSKLGSRRRRSAGG